MKLTMLSYIITTTPRYRRYASRARAMLRFLGRSLKKSGAVEVHVVGDGVMRKNVLSYEAPKNFPRPDMRARPLGEIYLNPAYIARHGEDVDRMLMHGFLHLLGYDHKRERDRMKMEKREAQLLAGFRRRA